MGLKIQISSRAWPLTWPPTTLLKRPFTQLLTQKQTHPHPSFHTASQIEKDSFQFWIGNKWNKTLHCTFSIFPVIFLTKIESNKAKSPFQKQFVRDWEARINYLNNLIFVNKKYLLNTFFYFFLFFFFKYFPYDFSYFWQFATIWV